MPATEISRTYRHIERPLDTNITWLMGNVGVWQKMTSLIEFEAAINFTTTNALFMEEPNIFTLTNGSSWKEQGFDVGDSFVVKWTATDVNTATSSVYTVNGTIVSINGSEMRSNNSTLGGGALQSNIYPTQFADTKIHSCFIVTAKRPQGIKFTYGQMKNSNANALNLASFIDGSFSVFDAKDTDVMAINAVVPMTFLGIQSGMSIASCNLKYIGQGGGTLVSKYYYEIEVIFMISSFFEDINTFEDLIAPDQVFDIESLTDNIDVIGFPDYNNPNVFIRNDLEATKQLGNTGWFNENFNGLPNPYTVTSVDYENLAAVQVVKLDYQNNIKVRAVIDGIDNISGSTKCTFGFAWIPLNETDYKNKPTGFYKNIKINTGGQISTFSDVFAVSNVIDPTVRSGYSNDGATMDVKNIRFQQTGANQITFEAEFQPSAAFASFMDARDETERNYILWANVADQTLVTNQSNRVCLLLDYGTLQTYVAPIGEYAGMNIGFLDHRQDENDTPASCGVDMRIEDDILAKITFQVDTAVSPTIPIPTGLVYGILVERASDGFQYLLDRYSIDLTQFPSPQQYAFNALRGFKLGTGNSKNKVAANYYAALDSGTLKGVMGLYGFKVRWEDWLGRNDMPLDVRNAFYDNSLKQNGLNNDWYRYLNMAGWTLNFFVYTDALLDGQTVRYANLKPMVFQDYNANADVSATFTYYRQSDNTVLTGGTDPESGLPLGVVLSNEFVRLEILWTRTVGTWANVNEVYALNCIEVREGAGQFEFRQLSSIWLPENDNPLTPLSGTLLNLTLVSPTQIKGTCLIDPSKLITAERYKISGRIGCA